MDVQEHYAAVMRDLIEKRTPLLEKSDELARQRDAISIEVEQLNSLIASMQKFAKLPQDEPKPLEPLWVPLPPYSGISMRWASLKYLYARKGDTVATGSLAGELIRGGYPQSTNLSSKLSAILGQMVTRGELARAEDGWYITDFGKQMWEKIRDSERYINRRSAIPPEETTDE